MGKSQELKKSRKTEKEKEATLANENEGLLQVLFCFGGKIAMREGRMTEKEIVNIKNLLTGNTVESVEHSIGGATPLYLGRRWVEAVIRECYEHASVQLNPGGIPTSFEAAAAQASSEKLTEEEHVNDQGQVSPPGTDSRAAEAAGVREHFATSNADDPDSSHRGESEGSNHDTVGTSPNLPESASESGSSSIEGN